MSIDDSLGGKSKQVLWNEAGWGTLGLLTRSERICGVAQTLLGGDVRHYFNKRLLKKPGDPGVWQWHQDYSYWYKDFFLFPHMQTIWVALDHTSPGARNPTPTCPTRAAADPAGLASAGWQRMGVSR